MERTRIGVVGVGSMGRTHVATFAAAHDAEVTYLCDPDERRLEEMAREFDVRGTTTELAELLAGDVDAVVVATPERLHLEPTLAALDAGKHVLVEKPFATDVAEARMMAEAAAHSGLVVMPGYGLRYEPRHRLVKDGLASGEGGPVLSLYLRRNRPAALFETYSRIHPAFESSSHDVDLMLWFSGRRARRVYAVHRGREGEPNPFGVWALIELEGGAVATIEGVWSIPSGARIDRGDVVEVIAERGAAHIDIADHGTSFWTEAGRTSPDPVYGPSSLHPSSLAIRHEVEAFLAAVRDGRPLEVSLEDAVHGVEIVDAMIRSAELCAPVDLEPATTQPKESNSDA